ncbi:hypothetical protein HanRHA438_Chr17g0832251 [Helianthus annuus]|uniref:Uncharacterized protein n=1 Tax=Helianthus annuus TaxID=4232 RepID=A0A251SK92_HELAN|nr:hypothetical protein HanXRQr2_Chr14g0657601 [Helianthus annuus]KAJ0448927.1 hypothetical protein HanHA89_Chr17g0722621 [Helianthus annuus]KAJ0571153.1 hypothetical protein HanHA300_Chr05g0186771 [Helianthus annuus]KAJ0807258.1 hypothetical protein HanOQP8_Chr00c063g0739361 [Helianthus annuus]KAJ0814783.1 hypothetical protein HanPSC8_Chr17g0789901 [Helianthus annuus]
MPTRWGSGSDVPSNHTSPQQHRPYRTKQSSIVHLLVCYKIRSNESIERPNAPGLTQ